ncbi:MAG: bifunctional hydroxymethylpyrimidine kinase/phosphomethylpyrimidine kinase [Treponema sp.]|nr:bifunctional hydroxymethylpyrimidine kinase/phosphomethylpyrimidine kinase [Treponema sp.]
MKTVLTIAGSDSSGGAGVQADIKTFTALGVYGMSVLTALTAQNTCGVFAIQNIEAGFVREQLDAVFCDIRPDAVKIGMTGSAPVVETIAERLRFYRAERIVVDPVMVSTSGSRLLEKSAVAALQEKLFPLATLITPNIPETEVLSGLPVSSKTEMEQAARKIYDAAGCSVLVKGGHRDSDSCDYLFTGEKGVWFESERIANPNTHGTGCTLSSAICAYLALGCNLEDAIRRAKAYITGALRAMLNLGKGSGPLNHMWNIYQNGEQHEQQ